MGERALKWRFKPEGDLANKLRCVVLASDLANKLKFKFRRILQWKGATLPFIIKKPGDKTKTKHLLMTRNQKPLPN